MSIKDARNIFNYYNSFQKYRKEKKNSSAYNIKFFNFWPQAISDMWFYRFIQSRNLLLKYPKLIINFHSTFGKQSAIYWTKGDINIFFTGENIRDIINQPYSDHLLSNKKIDLSLGFEHISDDRYLRFPLWILYMFAPEATEEDIIKRCKELSYPHIAIEKRTEFSSHVSRADTTGIRKEICESLMTLGKVDCAGKFMHNDDNLVKKYGDNKPEYLKNYKFNICPENSNLEGYVTEKIFESIESGCIPIYWGSNNKPEPDVLNEDAILFWEKSGDNSKTMEFIRELNNSPELLESFMKRAKLKENAHEKIVSFYQELEAKIKAIIEQKA